jgi:putative transposase
MSGAMRRSFGQRKQLRLAGFDYAEPGDYFITICTAEHACIFGEVADGMVILSPLGRLVEECLKAIPRHDQSVRVRVFQMMPNHLHAILEIARNSQKERGCVGVEYIQPLHIQVGERKREDGFQRVRSGSLSSAVRTFKAAVTRLARLHGIAQSHIWQRSYYDRIIRDDVEYYHIEQYIRMNPVLWHLDRNNPRPATATPDEIRRQLCGGLRCSLDEAERIIDTMTFA